MQPLFQTDQIFSSLVSEINHFIHEDVIITNEEGVIVASTDPSRIGNFHEGAFLAMQKREKMIMTKALSETLQGVRKGIVLPIIIENNPYGVLGITGHPEKVEAYARLVQKVAELFIKGTIDQMTEEKIARNLELFVFDWITGTLSEEVLLERSRFFHIDIRKYAQVISLHLPNTMNNLTYKEINQLRIQWDQKGDAIFVRWGQGKILIIDKGYERTYLREKIHRFLAQTTYLLEDEVYVGVGQQLEDGDITTSYEQAERACQIARKEKQIVFEEELQFEMIQYGLSKETKEKFIERTIAPLLKEKTMLQTLSCWLEHDMSIQHTAASLHIHKNTLYYRLEKIASVTKLDLHRMDHLVLLYMAIRFLQEKES